MMHPTPVRFLPKRAALPRGRGFTLIEMIVVIAIAGVVASILLLFFMKPFQEYADISRRTALVESAESALRLIARDIRNALPKNVLVTNSTAGFSVELIPIIDAGKYQTGGQQEAKLNVKGDTEFNNAGCFKYLTPGTYPYRIVVNSTGVQGFDAYAAPIPDNKGIPVGVSTSANNTITVSDYVLGDTPLATCPTPRGEHHILLSAEHKFKGASAMQRFFVVDKPVTYICRKRVGLDPNTGTIVRYTNYPDGAHPKLDSTGALVDSSGALVASTSAVVATNVEACSFPTPTVDVRFRSSSSMTLTVSQLKQGEVLEVGEKIHLIQQVNLDNSP